MFNWFTCNEKTKCKPQAESVHTWTSQTESVHVKKDDMINSEKEKIINSFRQGHLILNYNKLNQMQKEKLNEQVELLELDVLDLNFFNLVKKKQGRLQGIYTRPEASKIKELSRLPPDEYRKLREIGYRSIAAGELTVVINAGGILQGGNLEVPRCIYEPEWKLNVSILELFLTKLKTLGKYAIKKYGKNFAGNRQPIMVLLMCNELEIEDLEEFLVLKKYFGYSGIICLSQSIIPNINWKGKIVMKHEDELSLSSDGSGGFLANLKRAKIFESWMKAKIKYLNVINISDLNVKVADPLTLGFFITNEYDCMSDCFERTTKQIHHPIYLQDSEGSMDLYDPFQVRRAIFESGPDIAQFESKNLNFFTTVKFLHQLITKEAARVFLYRIKEKNLKQTYTPKNIQRMSISPIDWLPKYFTFELSIFNIMRLTTNSCLVLRKPEDSALFKWVDIQKDFHIDEIIGGYEKMAEVYLRDVLRMNPGDDTETEDGFELKQRSTPAGRQHQSRPRPTHNPVSRLADVPCDDEDLDVDSHSISQALDEISK